MNVVIIEDEALASDQLGDMILEFDSGSRILTILESVEESVEWFRTNKHPDLIFLDIQLEDDLSFAIFDQVEINCPVIFTTAFDEYAIRAFKLKSIDYLLKPIVQDDLENAMKKYKEMTPSLSGQPDIREVIQQIRVMQRTFRERFAVKVGQKIRTFNTDEVAWFLSDDGVTTAQLKDGKSYVVDLSLGRLQEELDPTKFFRINRKMLISLESISEVHIFSGSRLKLELLPNPEMEVLVSIDRVTGFKNWLDDSRD